ncbi:unnamed protein product, partial [marine sediment metagenome]
MPIPVSFMTISKFQLESLSIKPSVEILIVPPGLLNLIALSIR